MLDNTLVLFGSASSAFHLSRNYPLILAGGKSMGFKHGQYLNLGPEKPAGGPWNGGREPWQKEIRHEDVPLANLFVTMLQRLVNYENIIIKIPSILGSSPHCFSKVNLHLTP